MYSAEYVPLGGVAMTKNVRLTQYSHGAGCGCKIAPATLQEILSHSTIDFFSPQLWVGHESRDDAAVMDLGDGTGIIAPRPLCPSLTTHSLWTHRCNQCTQRHLRHGRNAMMAIAI